MSVRIGQASLGETGAHGQKPGNQTGRELNFAYWYSGSWLGVLRFKDRRKAELAAQACEAGVGNKNIGYDQDGRNTAYVAAEAVDFILSKIAKPVETDCSAFMMLCAISAGVDALKETYRKQGNSCTTYCMMRCFPATGEFELLTDRKYLTSDAYLRRGDILVSSGHTVMVLENGEKEDDDMDKATFTELFREISQKIADRPGGYTRILKTGNRLGDNAKTCFIELVDYNENMLKGKEAKKATRTRRSRKASAPAAEAPATEAPAAEAPATEAPAAE